MFAIVPTFRAHTFRTLRRPPLPTLPRPATLLLALTLLALPLLAGCASSSGSAGAEDPFGGGEQPEMLEIEIQNNDTNEATIWVLSSSGRERLGRVRGHQSRVFEVRWSRSRRLRLEIDFLAGDTCVTNDIQALPGERIHLNILSGQTSRGC